MTSIYALNARVRPPDNITINGVDLMTHIPQYQQVEVQGRGLVDREVTSTVIPLRRGVHVDSVRDKPLELKVKYIMDCNGERDLVDAFERLNTILRAGEWLKVVFADDPTFSYQAVFSSIGEVSIKDYKVQGSFILLVPDPMMKSILQLSFNGRIRLSKATQVLPNKIACTVSENAEEIVLSNGRQQIRVVGHYTAGKSFEVVWTEDDIQVNYDRRSILHELSHLSAPEEFYIRNGDQIVATHARIIGVQWRDEKL